jgi:hypothetical protein
MVIERQRVSGATICLKGVDVNTVSVCTTNNRLGQYFLAVQRASIP